jgi:exodeoxyribonuclease VII small subunit
MARESTAAHADIAAMSFETAVAELEAIVRKLESGQGELEAAIADYTRGTALKDHCIAKLEAAKLQLDTLVKGADGAPTAQATQLPE